MISKIIKTISIIIGWFFVIFFIIFAIVYYKYPIPLLCFLICSFLACPLIQRLPIKLKLWLRIPLAFILFTVATIHIPESNQYKETIPTSDVSISTITESKSVSTTESESTSNLALNSKESNNDNVLQEGNTNDNTEENKPFISEEEFKSQCIEYWHDDIFFSEKPSKGEYIKLDLFVEEMRFFDLDAVYAWPSSDLINEYDLQRDFFYCGVQRKDKYSYVGGQINLFFSNQYECSSSDINVGDHLILYGEVIEFSTTSTDGYNYCSVIPRYIENNGQ